MLLSLKIWLGLEHTPYLGMWLYGLVWLYLPDSFFCIRFILRRGFSKAHIDSFAKPAFLSEFYEVCMWSCNWSE